MTESIIAFLGTVSIFGLWGLFFFVYRDYRNDLMRQRLFAIRDRLFDEALDGNIDFNASAYGMTRTILNGVIRFSHDLSFFRFALVIFAESRIGKNDQDTFNSEYDKALKGVSDEQKELLAKIQVEMATVVLTHMVHCSFIFAPIVITVKVVFIPLMLMNGSRKIMSKLFSIFDGARTKAITMLESLAWNESNRGGTVTFA